MWRRNLCFDVCPRAGTAWGSCAHVIAARLYSVAASGAGAHTAKCILPVIVSAASADTKLPARHGMIDFAALYVLTTVAGRDWDAGVGACGLKVALNPANEVCVGQAEDTGTVWRQAPAWRQRRLCMQAR